MRSFSDAIGATTLRGDATGIIHNYVRSSQGQAAASEPPKRAPLHTVALALVRSRAATIVRRFKGLHPAVQGVSIGAFAMAIVAAALLRPELGPITSDSNPGPSQSVNHLPDGQGGAATSPPIDNGPTGQQSRTASARATPDKGAPAPPRNNTFPLGYVPSDIPKQPPLVEKKPASQPQGSNTQEEDKQTIAEFEAAKKRGNYGGAFDIAKKMDMAGDPAGAYGQGDFYFHGYGLVSKDPTVARGFFLRAAEMGYPMAMVKLGVMYHDGVGGAQSTNEARTWFEKAAASGDGEAAGQAMWALGTMCKRSEAGLCHCDPADYYARARAAGYAPDK